MICFLLQVYDEVRSFSERCYLRILQALFTVRTRVPLVDNILVMFDWFVFQLSEGACLQRAFFFSGFGLCVQIKSIRYLRALKETKSNSVVRQMLNNAFMSFLPFSLTCLKLGLPCSWCFGKVRGIF